MVATPSSSAFLVLLAPGDIPHHEDERLLRHAAGRLAAPRHDRLLRLLPGVARHRPGDHHRFAVERLRRAPAAPAPPPVVPAAPGSSVVTPAARRRSSTARCLVGQELGHARGDHPPTPSTAASSSTARPRSPRAFQRPGPAPGPPSGPGDGSRAPPAAGSAAARFDASIAADQVGCREPAEPLELRPAAPRSGRRGRRGSSISPAADQLETRSSPSPSMSMAAARGEVGDALHPLRRAVDVGAVGVALARQPHQRLAAGRARRRELPLRLAPLGTPGPSEHRADHLGDDVARLAHDDQVARAGRPWPPPGPRCAGSPHPRWIRPRRRARGGRTASPGRSDRWRP